MEETLPIDLNELQNWGCKGVIFGDRADLYQEVGPFKLRQGGRIKKYSEDKIIDIKGDDELDFCNVKSRIIHRYRMFYKECVILKYPYEKFKEPEPIPALPLPADVLREQGTSMDDDSESLLMVYSGGEVGCINTLLYEDEWEHVLTQVNLEMVKLAEENVLRVQQGQNPIPLDNVTKLNLFFQMTQAENMDPTRPAMTPQTLCRSTFNFPQGFDENREMGEEGEESFDRGEDEGMETEDTPPVDDRPEHEHVSGQVLFTTQGMATEDDSIEPKGDDVSGHVNQGMETEETDENAMESVEGNDTDETIDYTCGVEVEIKTEYKSGRHICFRGDWTWVFKWFFQKRNCAVP